MKKRLLVLENDGVYESCGSGANHYQVRELVFDTGMSGYREVLSDLSYYGQIVMMTYPMIEDYGVNRDDPESLDPAVFGFVVKEHCAQPSNFRCGLALDGFLGLKEIPGICHVDMRAITRKLRNSGTVYAIMANADTDVDVMARLLKETDFLYDQIARVSTQKPFPILTRGKKAVLMNFRAKCGIIRELLRKSCDLVVAPYSTSTQATPALHPDDIMLSNGPRDPKDTVDAIREIRELIKHVPVFGICLGHQLTSLTCGANTVKLKFGHYGCNHPVLNLSNKKVEITSQNHGYAVEAESLTNTDLIMAHQTPNNKDAEDTRHKHYPVFSVQYHPEAAPGPGDVNYLLDQSMRLVEKENV